MPLGAVCGVRRATHNVAGPCLLALCAVLALEAEVEAFVLTSEEPQHIFSGDMSSYEVRPASCPAMVAADGREEVLGVACAQPAPARAVGSSSGTLLAQAAAVAC